MPKTIDVAVITQAEGAHLPDYFGSLGKIDACAGVTVVDPSGRCEALAKQHLGDKLKHFLKDPAELYAKFPPKLVIVSLEAVAAPPVIDAALDAGCHVVAEKPSCLKAADFEKLVRKAEQKHRHLMMAFANRQHAPVAEAKKLIAAGKLGKIYSVEAHLVTDQTRLKSPAYHKTWFASKARAGGGQLTWVGIHWLDLILFVTGLKVKQVTGFAGLVGGQPIDIEDAAVLSMQFDNGGFGTMNSGYYLDKGYHSHVQIWGEKGWMKLHTVEELPLEYYTTADGLQTFEYPKGGRGYLKFMQQAVAAACEEGPAPVNPDEALHVLKTIYSFYDAARTGKTQIVN